MVISIVGGIGGQELSLRAVVGCFVVIVVIVSVVLQKLSKNLLLIVMKFIFHRK